MYFEPQACLLEREQVVVTLYLGFCENLTEIIF